MAAIGKGDGPRERATRLQWDIDPTPEPNVSGRVRNVRLRYRNQRAAASAAEKPGDIRRRESDDDADAAIDAGAGDATVV